jgi:hypothetical protein
MANLLRFLEKAWRRDLLLRWIHLGFTYNKLRISFNTN